MPFLYGLLVVTNLLRFIRLRFKKLRALGNKMRISLEIKFWPLGRQLGGLLKSLPSQLGLAFILLGICCSPSLLGEVNYAVEAPRLRLRD